MNVGPLLIAFQLYWPGPGLIFEEVSTDPDSEIDDER